MKPRRHDYRALGVFVLITTSSCHLLYRSSSETTDAAESFDAAVDATAAVDAKPACNEVSLNIPLTDDTILTNNGVTHSGPDAINVGTGISSTGIFRFRTSMPVVPDLVRRIELTLPRAKTANSCGINCAPCNGGFETPGTFAAHPMRADWVEGQANWTNRTSTAMWDAAGAAGSADFDSAASRSAMIVQTATKLQYVWSGAEDLLRIWNRRNQMDNLTYFAFRITPVEGVFVVRGKGSTCGDQHGGNPEAASLNFVVCQR